MHKTIFYSSLSFFGFHLLYVRENFEIMDEIKILLSTNFAFSYMKICFIFSARKTAQLQNNIQQSVNNA
jgi:hypothetical protein